MIKGFRSILLLFGIVLGCVLQSPLHAQHYSHHPHHPTLLGPKNEPGYRQSTDFQSTSWAYRKSYRQPTVFVDRSQPPLVRHFVRMSLDADTHFDFDKATLKPEGIAVLNRLIHQIAALDPGYGMGRYGYVTGIHAVGHTDWVGSHRYNDRLGARRANTVRNYLIAQGIPGFINTQSMGEVQPIADNRTSEGRALNRRVEVMVSTVTVP